MRMKVSKSHRSALSCLWSRGFCWTLWCCHCTPTTLFRPFVFLFLIPEPLLITKQSSSKQPSSPCCFLAFFCFLFAPDKRLIVVCYLLPRSRSSWLPNWHSLLHQAEWLGLPSASSFSHSKWSEYKQELYWSISVVLCLFFFSVLLFLSIFMFRFVVSL